MARKRGVRKPKRAGAVTNAVWVHRVRVWCGRAGWLVLILAAVAVVQTRLSGASTSEPAVPDVHGGRAAAMISERFGNAPVFAVEVSAQTVTVKAAGFGCWQVGIDSSGRPVWPASPVGCPPGEVDVNANTAASHPATTGEQDAAAGWAREVVSGGHPERWTAPSVPVPAGPWVGKVTDLNVRVSSNTAGLWVGVSGRWDGRLFEAGWQVTVGPRGDQFEVTSIGPAAGGVEPAPIMTASSTSTTVKASRE